jgi:putative transposase
LLPKLHPSRKSGAGEIGVDFGISNVLTLSDGIQLHYPDYMSKSALKVRTLQLKLSHKKRGSRNYQKAKLSLEKSWRKVRRQRSDFAEKVSDRLTRGHGLIVFEDLNVPKMVKNHKLASAIMGSGWGMLRKLTASKAETRGGRVILVNPSGTSQKCSGCGELVRKSLSQRIHECQCCGLTIDRDVNAARNILERGLERARAEVKPLLVQRRRISKFCR